MYNDHRDYLQHARAHKYILKIGKGINARYFYTQQEINAFRNKGQRNSENKSRPDDRPPQYPTLKMPTLKRSGTTTQKKYRPDDRIPSYPNTGQNVRKAGSALKKAGIKAGNKVAKKARKEAPKIRDRVAKKAGEAVDRKIDNYARLGKQLKVANAQRKKAQSLKLAKEATAKRKALKAKKNKDARARRKAFVNRNNSALYNARTARTRQEVEAFRNSAGFSPSLALATLGRGRAVIRSTKRSLNNLERKTRPTRKKIARTVKREVGELQRDATRFTKKAKRNIKKSIGTAKRKKAARKRKVKKIVNSVLRRD